jgi:hypothetical protein
MRFSAWDAGLDAVLLQRIPEPLGIIAPVGELPPGVGQIIVTRLRRPSCGQRKTAVDIST